MPGASQARKLGLKPGQRVALVGPPPGWALSYPPDGLFPAGAIWAAWPRRAAARLHSLITIRHIS